MLSTNQIAEIFVCILLQQKQKLISQILRPLWAKLPGHPPALSRIILLSVHGTCGKLTGKAIYYAVVKRFPVKNCVCYDKCSNFVDLQSFREAI